MTRTQAVAEVEAVATPQTVVVVSVDLLVEAEGTQAVVVEVLAALPVVVGDPALEHTTPEVGVAVVATELLAVEVVATEVAEAVEEVAVGEATGHLQTLVSRGELNLRSPYGVDCSHATLDELDCT